MLPFPCPVCREPDKVGAGFLSLSLFVRRAENQDASYLACTVRESHDATDHLVRLTRVHTEADGQLDRGVELGVGNFLHQGAGLSKLVLAMGIYFSFRYFLIFCQLAHCV